MADYMNPMDALNGKQLTPEEQIAAAAQMQVAPEAAPVAPTPVQQPTPDDPRLTVALEQQAKQRKMADLLKGFQQVLQGSAAGSGFKADFSYADEMNKRADEPVTRYKEKVAAEGAARKEGREVEGHKAQMSDFQMKLAKSKLDFTDMTANRDPASPQSKLAQDRVIELQRAKGQPVNEASIRGQSGESLFKIMPELQKDLSEFYQNQRADNTIKATAKENDLNRKSAKELNDADNATALEKARLDAEQKAKEALEKKESGVTEGVKAMDKDYAKQYNTFTGPQGKAAAQSAVAKMKELVKELRADTGLMESGGGRFSSVLPDVARSDAAIRRRDGARNLANHGLKATFGAQLSDGEREAAAKEYYNDRLGNAENADILEGKIKELENGIAVEERKAKFFEKNKTLNGFTGNEKEETKTGPYGDTTTKDGKTYKWNAAAGKYQLIG